MGFQNENTYTHIVCVYCNDGQIMQWSSHGRPRQMMALMFITQRCKKLSYSLPGMLIYFLTVPRLTLAVNRIGERQVNGLIITSKKLSEVEVDSHIRFHDVLRKIWFSRAHPISHYSALDIFQPSLIYITDPHSNSLRNNLNVFPFLISTFLLLFLRECLPSNVLNHFRLKCLASLVS